MHKIERAGFIFTLALVVLIAAGLILGSGCSSAHKPAGEPKAAIVDQLYTLEPNQPLIDDLTAALKAYGLGVDYFQGDQVTVDFCRGLPAHGYQLIIFRAHSGLLGAGGKTIAKTCLFTAEPYSERTHISEQMTDQLAKARIDENHPWVFAIGAEFVNRSMQEKFDRTVILMMGCSTLYIDDLARAFIDKGASAFFGWDATVGLTYVDGVTPVLLKKLLFDKISVAKAISETLSEKGPDPDYGAGLQYYPPSSGSENLAELLK
jgi:hypothetical protein